MCPEGRGREEGGQRGLGREEIGLTHTHTMVLSRRVHARPTRRRSLAYTTAAFLAVMFYLFQWHPFFAPAGSAPQEQYGSPSSSTSSSSTTVDKHPGIAALNSNDRGGLPLAKLLSGNPPYWRDPRRDFQAEYDEVREAVPGLAGIRPARFAFLIMAHGPEDVKLLKRNLPWLYSPLNFFLVSHSFRICVVRGRRYVRGRHYQSSQRQQTPAPPRWGSLAMDDLATPNFGHCFTNYVLWSTAVVVNSFGDDLATPPSLATPVLRLRGMYMRVLEPYFFPCDKCPLHRY